MQCPHCRKHFISKATQRPAPMRDKILALLDKNGSTIGEIAEMMGGELSTKAISNRLIRYEKAGLVRRNGWRSEERKNSKSPHGITVHHITRWVQVE